MSDTTITQCGALSSEQHHEVNALVAATSRAHVSLSEHKRLGLDNPADPRVHLLAHSQKSGALVGYAQLAHQGARTNLEVVTNDDAVRSALVAVARTKAAAETPLQYWLFNPTSAERAAAEADGFAVARSLVAMTLSGSALDRITTTLSTESFDPERDTLTWLEQNRRAFAGHLEQQDWTSQTLQARMHEPWFRPDGFRIVYIDGALAGSCLCKVTHHDEHIVGEIYVIGVDPAFQGRGLGRDLTSAGIVWMREVGVTLVSLYVDGDNEPAQKLYEKLGFVVEHCDVALRDTTRSY